MWPIKNGFSALTWKAKFWRRRCRSLARKCRNWHVTRPAAPSMQLLNRSQTFESSASLPEVKSERFRLKVFCPSLRIHQETHSYRLIAKFSSSRQVELRSPRRAAAVFLRLGFEAWE